MPDRLSIQPYQASDHGDVRVLYITVNRLLAPAGLADAFETYIDQSLAEEIDQIPDYYKRHKGSFWVARQTGKLVGMFGLEACGVGDLELRRMYVDPTCRRQGIARKLLAFAETESRRQGAKQLFLSTSELQPAALGLYRASGYQLLKEETADAASNKTIGGGIRRFYFVKPLSQSNGAN